MHARMYTCCMPCHEHLLTGSESFALRAIAATLEASASMNACMGGILSMRAAKAAILATSTAQRHLWNVPESIDSYFIEHVTIFVARVVQNFPGIVGSDGGGSELGKSYPDTVSEVAKNNSDTIRYPRWIRGVARGLDARPGGGRPDGERGVPSM